MMLSAVLLTMVLAAATPRVCMMDGDTVAGRFSWLSLTRPAGKPIPAPYLLVESPVCLHTARGVFDSRQLRLFPRDAAALAGLKSGDTLVVSARYGLPTDFVANGDIAAYDARLERQ